MLVTSALIPGAATWHTLRGLWRHRHAGPWRGLPDLVLFDRDGTLVHDVAYNGDPERVRPVDGAAPALRRLRSAGVRTGVVSNQSGVARGLLSLDEVSAVNARIDELLGPFDVWQTCPHGPEDGCACRKPAPGMVADACRELDVQPARSVVVGDIGSDVRAAEAAGAVGVLVPTPATRSHEVTSARHVCPDLPTAVDHLLAGHW
jgi:histidinol-phosphate phosphatase family protein